MPTEKKAPAKQDELNPAKGEALVKSWLSEISDALKREKKYRVSAQKCVDLYEAKAADQTPFAILYSNVETLAPSVYNSIPVPVVTRRYKDSDPIGKAVSEVSTRMLKYMIINEGRDYDSFDDLMQPAVLDSLVTNRGLTRFRYVAQDGKVPECVYGEAIRWDKFFHGYARTWKKVPWIGFEWDFSKEELKENFPDAPIEWDRLTGSDDADAAENPAEDREELTGVKTFKAYEIWDKETGMVLFISNCCRQPLRHVKDPLGLSGFFPIPRPLNFMRKITTLVPTPLYEQYRQQAQELNDITRRLKAIIKAIKFRGAYNSAVEGIEKILTADDNEMVPVTNMASMPDGSSIDKVFWTVPVSELASTAQSLYQQRESVKSVIYEITGISDILRGASVASETATAQQLKSQWGTLRLRKMQKEVQRYCRDALAIMLEIAAAKFELPTIKQMTGLPYFTNMEKKQVMEKIQQQMMQAQQQAAMQPQPGPPQPVPQGQPPAPAGPPGQPPAGPPQPQPAPQAPPAPPPVPIEVQQALNSPSWEDIMSVLQDGVSLHYKTDIETNSTIDAEASQDKQDIAELMNAISQFLNGVAPLVENGTMPMEVAKAMLLQVSRRFNFGSQLEDALNAMQAPQPQVDPTADAKNQAVITKSQADSAASQAVMDKLRLESSIMQQEFEQKTQLANQHANIAMLKLSIQQASLGHQMDAMNAKAQYQAAAHAQRMEALNAKPTETPSASV